MSKIYVFAIGGTGSRVLRSLTMLLASGVSLGKGVDAVVPIIIDPDVANGDLTRAAKIMRDYDNIHRELKLTHLGSRFFSTELQQVLPGYTLPIDGTANKQFRSFIDLSSMSRENQAMMQMLFSQDNLNADMQVGFKGNPNIGSVVLNQVVTSREFVEFANSFKRGDKIFIISSIFGGTGASGFPLLVKTLRTNKDLPNFAAINEAEIGAVTLLPYFQVKQDEESAIDSSTFISKAKSALTYYEKNVAQQGQVNALYYLGDDDKMASYPNNEGSSKQQNEGHLIELLAATAIVDFCHCQHTPGVTDNKELGVELGNEAGALTFRSFGPALTRMLRRPMTQMMLMANYLFYNMHRLDTLDLSHSFSKGFLSSQDLEMVRVFTDDYRAWLAELSDNSRSLDLFDINCTDKPFDVVKGFDERPWRTMQTLSKKGYDLFDDRLNRAAKQVKADNDYSRFMEMFHIATGELCENKLKL